MWLPSVHASLNYNLPPALGGRLPTDISSAPADYLPDLKFAAMLAAEARYDRFSVLSDFIYMSMAANQTRIKSLDFFGLPSQPISPIADLGSSSTLKAAIWTLTGGYTVVREDWVDLDLMAGFRFATVRANTDYDLNLLVMGPRGNGAVFGGAGSISVNRTIWNGIAGIRGRIRLPEPGMFIPYYFDIGAGGSKLTWQVASGLGYQTGWAGVSLLYRYLAFEQHSGSAISHLAFGGPMVVVNFTF
jgi:hypothetical protein